MTSAKPKLPKILRWLSPLLLVSLGLHGLGLLVPVPENPVEIERPEFVEPESIQVSTLPIPLELPPEPEPPPPVVESPPPLPPPVVESSPEPFPFQEEFFEEEFFEEEFLEEDPLEGVSSDDDDDSAFDDSAGDMSDDDMSDDDMSDDDMSDDDGSIDYSTFNAQGTSEQDGQLAALAFSAKYPGVAVATNIPLVLTYIADKECFDPLPRMVQLGAAVDNSGGIVETALFRKSGYQKIDDWLERLVVSDELPPEAFAGLSIDSGYLPDWINETRSNGADPLVPPGETAKAYAIQVNITVQGNRCE